MIPKVIVHFTLNFNWTGIDFETVTNEKIATCTKQIFNLKIMFFYKDKRLDNY